MKTSPTKKVLRNIKQLTIPIKMNSKIRTINVFLLLNILMFQNNPITFYHERPFLDKRKLWIGYVAILNFWRLHFFIFNPEQDWLGEPGSWFFSQAAPAPGIFFGAAPAPRGQKNQLRIIGQVWQNIFFPQTSKVKLQKKN